MSLAKIAAAAAALGTLDLPPTLPPLSGDAEVMAIAAKAVGKPCVWVEGEEGPHIAGFTAMSGVGQTHHPAGTIVLRRRGAQRVAFLAYVGETRCRILDAQPLPAKTVRESFEQCEVQDPRPEVYNQLAAGLGAHERGARAVTFFLVADFKAGKLVRRDPRGDKRIQCNGFESGD